jgi:pimeloyl-ACP methyl ester carboxylesterase
MISNMTSLRPPRLEAAIVLEDDRQLGYAEYGPSHGRPVIWFHGSPGARRQISPSARDAAHDRDVRIIAVERPGIGASTPHLYESMLGFAVDIRRLCDALEVERFSVAGLSGGGPYALACAHEMPEQVVSVAVLGGVAPTVGRDAARGGLSPVTRMLSPVVARTRVPLGAALRGLIRVLEPLADQAIDLFARTMPPGDQRVFADRATRQMFADDLIRGSRHHMQAMFLDAVLFGRHWGFQLDAIQTPVHLWYGDADTFVPVAHAEHMAERIPNSTLVMRPDEGHLASLGASHEIIDTILSHWPEEEDAGR